MDGTAAPQSGTAESNHAAASSSSSPSSASTASPVELPISVASAPTPRKLHHLCGRVSIPLPIPIATDLVRKPNPSHGIDGLGELCKHALGRQAKHVTGAVQTVVSREGCIRGTENQIKQLESVLSETDLLMSDLVDGLGRLEVVLVNAGRPILAGAPSPAAAAAAPALYPTAVSRGGWIKMKAAFKQLIASNQRNRQPILFQPGMLSQASAALNSDAAHARSAPTSPPRAAINVSSSVSSSTLCVGGSASSASIQSLGTPQTPFNSSTALHSFIDPYSPAIQPANATIPPPAGELNRAAEAEQEAEAAAGVTTLNTTAMVGEQLQLAAATTLNTTGTLESKHEQSSSSPESTFIFRPVPIQSPLCRHYQKSAASPDGATGGGAGACPLGSSCTQLHIFEHDCTPFRAYRVDDCDTAAERVSARRGLPYILYHLAVGEEAQYSLLRRTLDQHAPLSHRTLYLRHARLHWATSPPPPTMKALLRPATRILHFEGFSELTHKHRYQAAIRHRMDVIQAQAACASASSSSSTSTSSSPWSHGCSSFSFYPSTFQLPSGGRSLLSFHRSLGGEVATEVEVELAHPTTRTRKHREREKTKTKSAQEQEEEEERQATREQAAHQETPDTNTSTASSEPTPRPLWQQFSFPNFLASYPHHFSSSSSSSSSTAPLWILKPYARGGGAGIKLTDWRSNVDPKWIAGGFVASRYIDRPLCLDKARIKEAHELPTTTTTTTTTATSIPASMPTDMRKFDLRLYVLLLSPFFPPSPSPSLSSSGGVDAAFPFQVFLYSDGLVRFASVPYTPDSIAPDRIGTKMDPFTHITNNSINVNNDKRRAQQKGCWENTDLNGLKKYFEEERNKINQNHTSPSSSSSSPYAWDWSYITAQVHHLVVHSVLLSDDYIASGLDRSQRWSFELLGLDVLIDADFRVHLCELNSMPDLNSSTPLTQYHLTFPVDHRVKANMLSDLFTALHFEKEAEEEEEEGQTNNLHTSTHTQPHSFGGFERII